MNLKEAKCINNISDAQSKIRKAKDENLQARQFIDKLADFTEEYIKVPGMKNLKTDLEYLKNNINKNNSNLEIINYRLDKQKEKIKQMAKLREEAKKFGR